MSATGTESDPPEMACIVKAQGPVAIASKYPPGITNGGGYSKEVNRPAWQVGVSSSFRGRMLS